MKTLATLITVCMVAAVPAVNAAAFAITKSHPAKGTKTCEINEIGTSKYLETHGEPYTRSLPRVYVQPDGAVSIGLSEDKFPGTKVYFLIDGKRYVGIAGQTVPLGAAGLAALKRDATIEFTFTRWPSKVEVSGADQLENFDAAYSQCLKFFQNGVTSR